MTLCLGLVLDRQALTGLATLVLEFVLVSWSESDCETGSGWEAVPDEQQVQIPSWLQQQVCRWLAVERCSHLAVQRPQSHLVWAPLL